MKSEPRAFASLSSGLLARKGAARPAMRPQGFGQGGTNLDDLGWNDMGHDLPRPTLAPVGEDGELPSISRTPLAGLTPISPVHDQQAEIEERFNAYSSDDEDGDEEEGEEVAASYGSLTGAPQPAVAGEEEAEEEALELAEELAVPSPAAPAPVVAAPVVPAPVMQVMPQASVAAPLPVSRAKADVSAKGKAAFTLRLDPARHLKLRLACAVTGRSAQQLVTRALDELLASMPELDAMAARAPLERASK